MTRLAILPLLLTFGVVHANDHMSSTPVIAEIYECSLNENVTPADVVALGSGEFKNFVTKNKLNVSSYLWEAVAINAPYDEPDLRWVNYFPTWKDQSNADQLWRKKGTKIQEKIYELVTCKKPFFFPMQGVAQPPRAQEKPLITMVCNLNDGKSIEDAMAYRIGINEVARKLTNVQIGSALFTPGIGLSSGWDYVAMVTGTHDGMATVMDTVRDGSLASASASAGLKNPATCVTDLHRSHMMVDNQN